MQDTGGGGILTAGRWTSYVAGGLQQDTVRCALSDEVCPLCAPGVHPRADPVLVQHLPHPAHQPILVLGHVVGRKQREDALEIGRRVRQQVCVASAAPINCKVH